MALERLPEEIVRLSDGEIVLGKVMLVDPRDYEIHELNARLENPERNMKQLEDSILEIGFREPCIADEHKTIIDGGRRWRIASKYKVYLPVIHKFYGEGVEADSLRAIDSILGNLTEQNTPTELGLMVNKIVDMGINISTVAKKLGYQTQYLTDWSSYIEAPKDVLPIDQDAELEEMFQNLTRRQRISVKRILKKKDLTPEEAVEEFKKLYEMSYSAVDSYDRDIHADTPVDLDFRHKMSIAEKKERWEQYHLIKYTKVWRGILRRRGWDRVKTIRVLWNGMTLGFWSPTLEEYKFLEREDLDLEGMRDMSLDEIKKVMRDK